jgi:hypothetical protein
MNLWNLISIKITLIKADLIFWQKHSMQLILWNEFAIEAKGKFAPKCAGFMHSFFQ